MHHHIASYNNVMLNPLSLKREPDKENADNQPNNTFFRDGVLSGTTLEIRRKTVQTVHHII